MLLSGGGVGRSGVAWPWRVADLRFSLSATTASSSTASVT